MSNKPKFLRNKHRLANESIREKQAERELNRIEARAEQRWNGAQKILTLIARGASVRDDIRGMNAFQQRYGF